MLANIELYERVKSDNSMNSAIREILEDELGEVVNIPMQDNTVKVKSEENQQFTAKMLRDHEPISKSKIKAYILST